MPKSRISKSWAYCFTKESGENTGVEESCSIFRRFAQNEQSKTTNVFVFFGAC